MVTKTKRVRHIYTEIVRDSVRIHKYTSRGGYQVLTMTTKEWSDIIKGKSTKIEILPE